MTTGPTNLQHRPVTRSQIKASRPKNALDPPDSLSIQATPQQVDTVEIHETQPSTITPLTTTTNTNISTIHVETVSHEEPNEPTYISDQANNVARMPSPSFSFYNDAFGDSNSFDEQQQSQLFDPKAPKHHDIDSITTLFQFLNGAPLPTLLELGPTGYLHFFENLFAHTCKDSTTTTEQEFKTLSFCSMVIHVVGFLRSNTNNNNIELDALHLLFRDLPNTICTLFEHIPDTLEYSIERNTFFKELFGIQDDIHSHYHRFALAHPTSEANDDSNKKPAAKPHPPYATALKLPSQPHPVTATPHQQSISALSSLHPPSVPLHQRLAYAQTRSSPKYHGPLYTKLQNRVDRMLCNLPIDHPLHLSTIVPSPIVPTLPTSHHLQVASNPNSNPNPNPNATVPPTVTYASGGNGGGGGGSTTPSESSSSSDSDSDSYTTTTNDSRKRKARNSRSKRRKANKRSTVKLTTNLLAAAKNLSMAKLDLHDNPTIRRQRFNMWVTHLGIALSSQHKTSAMLRKYPDEIIRLTENADHSVYQFILGKSGQTAMDLNANAPHSSGYLAFTELYRQCAQVNDSVQENARKKLYALQWRDNESASSFLRRFNKSIGDCQLLNITFSDAQKISLFFTIAERITSASPFYTRIKTLKAR